MIKDGKILGEYELNTKKNRHLLKAEEIDSLVDKRDIKNIEYITFDFDNIVCWAYVNLPRK